MYYILVQFPINKNVKTKNYLFLKVLLQLVIKKLDIIECNLLCNYNFTTAMITVGNSFKQFNLNGGEKGHLP